MFKRGFFITSIVTLCVICYEINIVKGDDLDFWINEDYKASNTLKENSGRRLLKDDDEDSLTGEGSRKHQMMFMDYTHGFTDSSPELRASDEASRRGSHRPGRKPTHKSTKRSSNRLRGRQSEHTSKKPYQRPSSPSKNLLDKKFDDNHSKDSKVSQFVKRPGQNDVTKGNEDITRLLREDHNDKGKRQRVLVRQSGRRKLESVQARARGTPKLMRLKDDEETGTVKKKKEKKNPKEPLLLNPYNIAQQLRTMVENVPNTNITIEILGRTVEYKDIVMLKMQEKKPDVYFRADETKYVNDAPEKKIIFIVHALSVMGKHYVQCLSSIYRFKQLLSYYVKHLDKFDIFLVPMANPDGETVETPQMWNKNLSPQPACQGVALDRNFDVAWNTSREVSSCSQQYPGPSPFSEPETRAIRDVFHRYSHKIIAYIHVHAGTYNSDSYKGDAILYPKGYTEWQPDDDKYIDLKGEIDEALKNASFQVYSVSVDTLYNWYGKVSGTSVDYATTVYGIPYAMEFVLQPYSDDEFASQSSGETNIVLENVWKRIIDVTFNSLTKPHSSDDTKID